jgi:hypothetical protein
MLHPGGERAPSPACYGSGVRPAPRAIAVLLAFLGLAVVPRPIQRVEGASEASAGLSRAGERGHVPAIRPDAGVERQVAHDVPLALPPAPPAGRVLVVAADREVGRTTSSAGLAGARANRARAPPPAA